MAPGNQKLFARLPPNRRGLALPAGTAGVDCVPSRLPLT